jgi:RNA-directed DNA polymerase
MMEENDINSFLLVKTLRELAVQLKIEYKILAFNLYVLSESDKYVEFEIKKRKSSKTRLIAAPNSGIKYIQFNLAKILLSIYKPKSPVNGFILDKSIKSNASIHVKKKYIINIDLENFFPSINFGRVRGLFLAYPFNFNEIVATTLAQICCYKGVLPQGAPTSPILSNFICHQLDNKLLSLLSKNKFWYTRYADDLTFSTNLNSLPKEIGVIIGNQFILSNEIRTIIKQCGLVVYETNSMSLIMRNLSLFIIHKLLIIRYSIIVCIVLHCHHKSLLALQ